MGKSVKRDHVKIFLMTDEGERELIIGRSKHGDPLSYTLYIPVGMSELHLPRSMFRDEGWNINP